MNEAQLKVFIERRAYQRPVENRRIEKSVIDTAVDKAVDRTRRLEKIQTAQDALQLGITPEMIAQLTKLSLAEIVQLATGESLPIDKEEDLDT